MFYVLWSHVRSLALVHLPNSSRSCVTWDGPKPWFIILHYHLGFNAFWIFICYDFKLLATRQHQTNLSNYQTIPSLTSIATSSLIHRLCICSTKTFDMILYLVPISLTNLDAPLIMTNTFHNGWITRYFLGILMSSLTTTCVLVSITNYVNTNKTKCLNKSSSTTMLYKY